VSISILALSSHAIFNVIIDDEVQFIVGEPVVFGENAVKLKRNAYEHG